MKEASIESIRKGDLHCTPHRYWFSMSSEASSLSVSQAYREVVKKELDEMMSSGIIDPSTNEWSADEKERWFAMTLC